MWIEEMFGDFKKHGFDLETTTLRHAPRLSRLTLAVVFLYVWLLSVGSRTIRARWGKIFERRRFVWIPLQTPGTAERLGITAAQLRAEMWLQLADGRKFSGVNAWRALMRRVWWLWPVGVMLAVPGFNAEVPRIARFIYLLCWP